MKEEERIQNRALAVFFLSTIQKKTISEIAKIFQTSYRTICYDLSRIRKQLQKEKEKITNIDLIYFYENEMKELMERRKEVKSHRYYLAYTKMIVELQEKIAEYLKLKEVLHIQHEHTGKVEINITNIVKNVVNGSAEKVCGDNSPVSREVFLRNLKG